MKLYYFTPAHFALSALALRRLKVARLADLNDPFELLAVDAATPLHREYFRRVKEKIDSTHGVLCFSKSWANPVLWGHYADKFRGVALGFEVTSPHLVPVIYAKTPIKIDTDPVTGLPQPSYNMVDQMQRTKFWDWHYEDEMRVYVELDPDACESGLYFYPFDASIVLQEIILGSRCELPVNGLYTLLGANEGDVKVIKTTLDSQSFIVVEATG